jgi:hypothetical protein
MNIQDDTTQPKTYTPKPNLTIQNYQFHPNISDEQMVNKYDKEPCTIF